MESTAYWQRMRGLPRYGRRTKGPLVHGRRWPDKGALWGHHRIRRHSTPRARSLLRLRRGQIRGKTLTTSSIRKKTLLSLQVTFEGLWSRNTHPKDFPSNGWLTRFSDVIGASHSKNYTFWKPGVYSSEGMRQLAENGNTRMLESELKAKVMRSLGKMTGRVVKRRVRFRATTSGR